MSSIIRPLQFSKVKFWQMIGRGTRKWTDPVSGEEKTDFLIIDHWDNFAYFQVSQGGREPSATEPMPSRLFRYRLEKLQILSGRDEQSAVTETLSALQAMLAALPLDNINLAPHAEEIRNFVEDANAWLPLTEDKLYHLSHTIAPLLRHAETASWAELQFENQTERLALAHLKADTAEAERLRERITEHLSLLPVELAEIRPHREALTFATSQGFWQHLDYARIMSLQHTFAPLMRFRQQRDKGKIIQISLPDNNAQRHWIVFGPGGEGCFADSYRTQVEALVLGLAEANPALRKLRLGQDVDDEELESVASQLSGPDWFVSEQRLREAYDQPTASFADFLRHILGETKLPSREAKLMGGGR